MQLGVARAETLPGVEQYGKAPKGCAGVGATPNGCGLPEPWRRADLSKLKVDVRRAANSSADASRASSSTTRLTKHRQVLRWWRSHGLRSLGGSLLRTGKLTERRDEFQSAAESTSRNITSGYFDCGIVRDRPCEGASSGIPVFLASHVFAHSLRRRRHEEGHHVKRLDVQGLDEKGQHVERFDVQRYDVQGFDVE